MRWAKDEMTSVSCRQQEWWVRRLSPAAIWCLFTVASVLLLAIGASYMPHLWSATLAAQGVAGLWISGWYAGHAHRT